MKAARRTSQQAWSVFCGQIEAKSGTVLEREWRGTNKPHRCLCPKGHLCSPRPDDIYRDQGMCGTCGHEARARKQSQQAWNDFRAAISAMGGLAGVLEPVWLGCNKPHRCLCAKGHECYPWPTQVQQGCGICKVCAQNDPVTAEGDFRKRLAKQGAKLLEPKWRGCNTPHLIQCAKGHKSSPTPGNVQRGQGICWKCRGAEHDVIYVTRNPVTCCVKFGITSRDGSLRLGDHRRTGYTEVLHLVTGLPEGLAAHTESKIKCALAMVHAKPVRGTEYFSDEYLDLIENEIANWVPGYSGGECVA